MIALKVRYLAKQILIIIMMIARQLFSLTETKKKIQTARKVHSLTKKQKGHDCTTSSFIDQKQKNANHDCTNSSFIDQNTNKVLIARKVHSLTKTKVMIARNVIIDQKQKS